MIVYTMSVEENKYFLRLETDNPEAYYQLMDACYRVMSKEIEPEEKTPEPMGDGWISVQDKLPETHTAIVMFVDRAYDSEGHIRIDRCQMFGEYWGDDRWEIDYPEVDRVVVTHWREMFNDPRID